MPRINVLKTSWAHDGFDDEDLREMIQERDGMITHRGRAALKDSEFASIVSSQRQCFVVLDLCI